MSKQEVWQSIVDTFEHNYSWLGRQFAEEMLLSVASWNIQQFSEPHFRVRRHLLLFWSPGFVKSSLLEQAHKILGNELSIFTSDVTLAALRGTVEQGRFITPYTLKRPFAICTEFGQIISGSESQETIQKLLNVLEEGIVTVSLAKISALNPVDREEIEHQYGIVFIDRNTFTYKTNWVLMAGTYNRKFLVDNALEGRFNIIVPEGKLDSALSKKITSTQPKEFDVDAVTALRSYVLEERKVDINVKLPDELFEKMQNLSVRQCGQLLSYKLCKEWWGLQVSDEELISVAQKQVARSEQVWKTADDMVFDAIISEPKTAKQIAEETGLSLRQVYYSLKNIRAYRTISKDDDNNDLIKWAVI